MKVTIKPTIEIYLKELEKTELVKKNYLLA